MILEKNNFRCGQTYVCVNEDMREAKRIALRFQAAGVNWRQIYFSQFSCINKKSSRDLHLALFLLIQLFSANFKNLHLKTGIFHRNNTRYVHSWIEMVTLDKSFIIDVSDQLIKGDNVKILPLLRYKEDYNFVEYIEEYSSSEVLNKLLEYSNLFPDDAKIEFDHKNHISVNIQVTEFSRWLLPKTYIS